MFLNGRPIRDQFIQHALREAYRGLTEPGRHPAAILLISMPPQDVDVNVHPTKSEVRFRDSSRIHGLVLSAVREKLLGSDLVPAAVPADSPRRFRGPIPNAANSANASPISSNPPSTIPLHSPPLRLRCPHRPIPQPKLPATSQLGNLANSQPLPTVTRESSARNPASQQLSRRRER